MEKPLDNRFLHGRISRYYLLFICSKMKQLYIKFAYLLMILSLSPLLYAQNVEESIGYLSENLGSVTTKKSQFSQNFGIQEGKDESCMVWYQYTPSGKGDEEKFSFNAADLNENRITFDTKKDLVIISAAVKGKKDLIREYENGEVSGYTDVVKMYANSVEDARKLVENLKALAASCAAKIDKQLGLGEGASKAELLAHLKEKIATVEVNDERFEQAFEAMDGETTIISYSQNELNESKLGEYKVNMIDFNAARIDFDTEKKQVVINMETKAKRNFIQQKENGELKNYANRMKILMPTIEEARNTVEVLKDLVRLAESEAEQMATMRSDTDPSTAMDYLGEEVEEVIINDDIYQQSFESDPDLPYMIFVEVKKEGDDEAKGFRFNISDLDPPSVDFDVKKNAVFVTAECAANKKLIQKEENTVVSGFTKDLEIRVKDIETARAIQKRLSLVVKHYRENRSNNFDLQFPDAGISEALDFCKEHIQKVGSDDKVFDQVYKIGEEGDCLAEIEVENIDKGETKAYLFNWADINSSKVSFGTKGKEILLKVETKARKELIQLMENGEVDDYERDFSIRVKDIETARALEAAMKVLAKSCSEN